MMDEDYKRGARTTAQVKFRALSICFGYTYIPTALSPRRRRFNRLYIYVYIPVYNIPASSLADRSANFWYNTTYTRERDAYYLKANRRLETYKREKKIADAGNCITRPFTRRLGADDDDDRSHYSTGASLSLSVRLARAQIYTCARAQDFQSTA